MKIISLLLTCMLCVFPCLGAEEGIPMVGIKSTPFAAATLDKDIFTFTLKKAWFSKKGDLKAERVGSEQKLVLKQGEKIQIYQRHTKIIIQNDGKGVVTIVTTFDGRSLGSDPKTKTEILNMVSIEPTSE